MAEPSGIQYETCTAVGDIDPEGWDRLVGESPPVLEHAFLSALEETGCVGPATGWLPAPIVARAAGDSSLLGAAPAYLKAHSMGEFVYDWAWADAAQRAGLRYYPKLVIAAPFSPVAGPRLLTAPELEPERAGVVARQLLETAEEAAREAGCTGVHMLFCSREEARIAAELGYAIRTGMQFHWRNDGYASFDDFLGRFRSKRRNQIRRERRRVREADIETISLSGDAIEPHHMAEAFRFYAATVDRFTWGRRYLNEALFEALWSSQRHRLQLTLATHRASGQVVGGTFNFEKAGRRHGRYWGCAQSIPMLHFEVCCYAAIEDSIGRGLQVFEAGAGGGHHKFGRGFLPVETYSAHKIFNPRFHAMIDDFCGREGAAVQTEIAELRDTLFIR